MSSVLVDAIGVPAMLEQTAEECSELAFACLKLARFIRGENKVHGYSEQKLYEQLTEEIADITVCLTELIKSETISFEEIDVISTLKIKRMERRLEDEKAKEGNT